MLDPEAVDAWIRDHFEHVTADEFIANVRRYNPDLALSLNADDQWQRIVAAEHRLPTPALHLRARIAAVENSGYLERLIAELLEKAGFTVTHEVGGTPVAVSVHLRAPEPSGNEEGQTASVVFVEGDVLKIEVEQGQPPQVVFTYRTESDLERCAVSVLVPLRRLAEQQALSTREGVNLVGKRIRFFREIQGLSRADLAARLPDVPSDTIACLECASDSDSNPSLLLLRRIATALNTTVSQLIEPIPMDLSILPFSPVQRATA
jgi:DNA-binding XRE family transcriptional regulator